MRVLLSTIGSRGDVQPLVALAVELRALGEAVRLCVPPDFRAWIEGLGFEVAPIGPELRPLTAGSGPAAAPRLTPERLRELAAASVAAQFETVAAAARGCDVVVAATMLQIAAHSVAERMGIPYVFTAYCPAVLPSPRHAPPVLGALGDAPAPDAADHRARWEEETRRWNANWGALLDARRGPLGLDPVSDVQRHILGDRPWLAADPALAPWPDPADEGVLQTGAWILPDERPLAPELAAFLDEGEPPVYFGLGSMRAPHDAARAMVGAARALGRRAVVSRGWGGLALVDEARDCLAIDEVNQQALFGRVAAVVHHGGAGTTTAAALAGAPQVVIPQMYDQHYWARRVDDLGVGAAHAPGAPTEASLTAALDRALRPGVARAATALSGRVRLDGAHRAARRLVGSEAARPA